MMTFLKVPPDVLSKIWHKIRYEQMAKEGCGKTYQMHPVTLRQINPKRRQVTP